MVSGLRGGHIVPMKPKHKCNATGCFELVNVKYCTKHEHLNKVKYTAKRKLYDQNRPKYYGLYDTARWRVVRERVLYAFPFCVYCAKDERVTLSTIVDHIIPHKGDQSLFWDLENLQGLCAHCHSVKTSKEESWNSGAL